MGRRRNEGPRPGAQLVGGTPATACTCWAAPRSQGADGPSAYNDVMKEAATPTDPAMRSGRGFAVG